MYLEDIAYLQERILSEVTVQYRSFSPYDSVTEVSESDIFQLRVSGGAADTFRASMEVQAGSLFEPKPDIAIGAVSGQGNRQFRLAVLVQDRDALTPDDQMQIESLSAGEVDFEYIGPQSALWTRNSHRPLHMGSSVSPAAANYSGTLGFFGLTQQNAPVIVSNNHVLADVNAMPIGTPVVQRGAGDGGRAPADSIAQLAHFVPIQFGGVVNTVDAAFAALDPAIGTDNTTIFGGVSAPVGVGQLLHSGSTTVLPGLAVQKTGRTTRHTIGRVRAINVNNYHVNMGNGRRARFDGQIAFEAQPGSTSPFSRPGDSGSLICDMSGVPVALLFAGSSQGGAGNFGIAAGNPILFVLSQLGIRFL